MSNIQNNLKNLNDTGTDFSLSTAGFSFQYYSTNAPYSFIYHWCYTTQVHQSKEPGHHGD